MKDIKNPIYITQPNLPPLEKVVPYLEKIWDNKILTNNGPLHQLFEQKLKEFLEVEHINLFTNATLALIVGLQALRITGEVITTPFSFVATSHALKWNGITPVFCDIEEATLNLNPDKIETLITPRTTAILPVHVYGYPSDVLKIQKIADIYGLKVIYDAAHAFNVKLNNKTILNYGDMSILSFHATKLYTTFEGGAIITTDDKLKQRIDFLKNFGFADEVTVVAPGINAKMNEFQAAIGLLQLEIVNDEINARKKVANEYRDNLRDVDGITIFDDFPNIKYNYSYFPILIDKEKFGVSREQIYNDLKNKNIFTRRYFYPLISNFPSYRMLPSANKENLPIANKISEKILCLPIYGKLDSVDIICEHLLNMRRR